MDIVIRTYIFWGAGIFALIVGVFSVYNGRITIRELAEIIERTSARTQQMMEEMDARTQQLLMEIKETQRYIADLIKAEGERTRSSILQ